MAPSISVFWLGALLLAAVGGSCRRLPLQAVSDGDLRLVGDQPLQTGLQVYYNGQWGSVCSLNFTQEDALVACAQLAYSDPSEVQAFITPNVPLTSGGPVWLWDTQCAGTEPYLTLCPNIQWGILDPASACLGHTHDVGLACFHVDMPNPLQPPSPMTPTMPLAPPPPPMPPARPCSPGAVCTGDYTGRHSNRCDASGKTYVVCEKGAFVRRGTCSKKGEVYDAAAKVCCAAPKGRLL